MMMTESVESVAVPSYFSAGLIACPCCGDSVIRVRRRLFDRVRLPFRKVQRYRCANPMCGWEHNFAVNQDQ
jgi:hypothetical protein